MEEIFLFIVPLKRALLNSCRGLKQAWLKERAFRWEVFLGVGIAPILMMVQAPRLEKLLVVFSFFLVLITELLNTAIEKANDAITSTSSPLVKFSKDAASAAVLLALCLCGLLMINLFL